MTHPPPRNADFLLVQVVARAIASHDSRAVTPADIAFAAKLLTMPFSPLRQFHWKQFIPAANGGHVDVDARTMIP
jgi:hypothetical protein